MRDVASSLASLALHAARRPAEITPLLREAQELWAERAAIREFDGGIPRPLAEFEALNDTIDTFNARIRARR